VNETHRFAESGVDVNAEHAVGLIDRDFSQIRLRLPVDDVEIL
jgi:hypothetical protein